MTWRLIANCPRAFVYSAVSGPSSLAFHPAVGSRRLERVRGTRHLAWSVGRLRRADSVVYRPGHFTDERLDKRRWTPGTQATADFVVSERQDQPSCPGRPSLPPRTTLQCNHPRIRPRSVVPNTSSRHSRSGASGDTERRTESSRRCQCGVCGRSDLRGSCRMASRACRQRLGCTQPHL